MSTVAQKRNFGDPAAEYAAASAGAVVHERTDRALLRVYGRDPVRIIQGIVTNDVAGLPSDRVAYAALLTPKGRMVADVRVVRRDAELLLDVPAAALDALLELFKRTIPPLFARFENVTGNYVMLGVYGPRALEMVAAAGVADASVLAELPARDGLAVAAAEAGGREAGDSEDAGGMVLTLTTLDTGMPGADMIVPAALREELMQKLLAGGAVQVGAATIDVLRIEAGTPVWGAELDETTIPLEADLLERAISTNKGCYTGQEVIIRVLHRGHVNWHLRGVLLGDVPTPARGTQLFAKESGRVVGRITSAAWSPKHRQTIALAYARRELAPPAAAHLGSADGPDVMVTALPFADASLP